MGTSGACWYTATSSGRLDFTKFFGLVGDLEIEGRFPEGLKPIPAQRLRDRLFLAHQVELGLAMQAGRGKVAGADHDYLGEQVGLGVAELTYRLNSRTDQDIIKENSDLTIPGVCTDNGPNVRLG